MPITVHPDGVFSVETLYPESSLNKSELGHQFLVIHEPESAKMSSSELTFHFQGESLYMLGTFWHHTIELQVTFCVIDVQQFTHMTI